MPAPRRGQTRCWRTGPRPRMPTALWCRARQPRIHNREGTAPRQPPGPVVVCPVADGGRRADGRRGRLGGGGRGVPVGSGLVVDVICAVGPGRGSTGASTRASARGLDADPERRTIVAPGTRCAVVVARVLQRPMWTEQAEPGVRLPVIPSPPARVASVQVSLGCRPISHPQRVATQAWWLSRRLDSSSYVPAGWVEPSQPARSGESRARCG
jgi:hypothetical protein